MSTSRVLRSILWGLGGAIALVVVALLIISLVRIPIDVSGYKGLIESAASDALGRNVSVEGRIAVTTSLWPYFEIEEIRIANPEGFEAGDFARMEHARVRIGLLALLERRIRVKSFRIDGLALDLRENARGRVNWVFGGSREPDTPPTADTAPDGAPPMLTPDALAVDEIVLENISTRFRSPSSPDGMVFAMERALGAALHGEPMNLEVNGALLDEPYTLRIEANSLGEFLAMVHSRMQIDLEIAETRLHLEGTSDAFDGRRTSELELRIDGERLDSLDDLLGIDLPPLQDYRLGAHLAASTGRLELSDLEVRVRDSTLNGSIVIDRTGKKPFAKIQLNAERIQLADFDTGEWSPDDPAPEATPTSPDAAKAESEASRAQARAKLLSPETLQRANLALAVEVDEVLSGDDALGSGHLSLELKDGRIALEPLELKLPGSRLLLEASVKPGRQASAASLRVLIEDFDFGALTRLSNPESDVGGTLSMDVDVTATASDIDELLTGANGYLDVAGKPVNVRSGIVDLWAVNLLSSVVAESAKAEDASSINCIVSRWSLLDGVMTARNLAVDTSKIRICGEGNVDFNDHSFHLTVSPTAKRPEFFSLATPLKVKGSFADFRIGAQGGLLSVGTTAVRFAVSPVTTPFKRLLREDLPRDGGDICELPIGPHEVELEPLPGC